MDNKTILVEKRQVYGNDLIYPLDYRQELYILTGQKTLSARHIRALREMGFDFLINTSQSLLGDEVN